MTEQTVNFVIGNVTFTTQLTTEVIASCEQAEAITINDQALGNLLAKLATDNVQEMPQKTTYKQASFAKRVAHVLAIDPAEYGDFSEADVTKAFLDSSMYYYQQFLSDCYQLEMHHVKTVEEVESRIKGMSETVYVNPEVCESMIEYAKNGGLLKEYFPRVAIIKAYNSENASNDQRYKNALQRKLRRLTTLLPYRHTQHNLLTGFRFLLENSPADSSVAVFFDGSWDKQLSAIQLDELMESQVIEGDSLTLKGVEGFRLKYDLDEMHRIVNQAMDGLDLYEGDAHDPLYTLGVDLYNNRQQ